MTKPPVLAAANSTTVRPDMEKQISGLLQSMYGAVQDEGIPERFLDLLEKLDRAERAQTTSKDH